jgi:two-component system, NtrC family, response regulator HydG
MPTRHDDETATRQLNAPRNEPIARGLRLVVIDGPDRGQSFGLDPNAPTRILLGSSTSCAIRLTDVTVSRRHLAFEPSGGRFRVIDLGSSNGTSINGVPVVDAFVTGGEQLRCGSTVLSVEATGAPAVTPSNAMEFGKFIGASAPLRRLYPLCERIARSDIAVLIEGETGTGKEVMAESIHEMSGRRGAYVVFDCTAVAQNLVEAELFGYEKGAFTGATTTRPGLFEEADGGTLLLDEIGDLDLALQAKLLRVVDRGEIRRVGGRQPIRADVRIIAATRRDLDREVAAGRFRDDLLHRLAIARIELPPLRDRKGDISLLARHFVESLGGSPEILDRELLARLEDYNWPGNVRELRNTIARRLAFGELEEIGTNRSAEPEAGAAEWIDALIAGETSFPAARRALIEEFERRFVERALAAHGGNATHAAAAHGIGARYFRMIRARRS